MYPKEKEEEHEETKYLFGNKCSYYYLDSYKLVKTREKIAHCKSLRI
jgi:hypothetical protein